MIISLIWAMTDERVIGIENRLPWKLPADMRWFRQHTLGKPIVMGRKTFESFGSRPLPDRQNIILTRNAHYCENSRGKGSGDNTNTITERDIEITSSLQGAVDLAQNAEELMVIGGADLYQQSLPRADRLYMTLVHADIKGDAYFPQFDLAQWRELERHDHTADEKNAYNYSFCILERK